MGSETKLKVFNGHDGGILLESEAISGDFNFPPMATPHGSIWSIQFIWDGTLGGDVILEASNVRHPNINDWVEMTEDHGFIGLINPIVGVLGSDLIDIACSGALWYRFRLINVTGSGNLSAYVNIINGFKTP